MKLVFQPQDLSICCLHAQPAVQQNFGIHNYFWLNKLNFTFYTSILLNLHLIWLKNAW